MAKSVKRKIARKMKKGGSAWQYTQSLYGGPDNQHSVGVLPNGGTSNLISMNVQSGGNKSVPKLSSSEFMSGGSGLPALNPSSFVDNPLSVQGTDALASSTEEGAMASDFTNSMSGGRSRRRFYRRRQGGTVFSEIAVPASLLIANEFGKYSTKNSYKGKTNKKRYNNKRNKTFRRVGRR